MTHLAWDECRAGVLACRRYGDHPNELPPFFPHCHVALMPLGGTFDQHCRRPGSGPASGGSPSGGARNTRAGNTRPRRPRDTPLRQRPPPAAAAPATPPPSVQTADPFGEEITLAAKKVVIVKGKAKWD